MSGVDESTKELTERLKKAMKSPDWPGNISAEINSTYGLQLPPALVNQISVSNTNMPDRIAAIKQLTVIAKEKIIREEQVEQLWRLMSDLLEGEKSEPSACHAAMALVTAVAISSNTSRKFGAPMRHIIFNYVSKRCNTDPIEPLFDLLSGALSKGKTLELVEDLVGPFYNSWYPKLLRSQRAEAAIEVFINLTKTNAAYLDEPELFGLTKQTVWFLNNTASENEGLLCLTAIETVVAYSHLPSNMIFSVVASLARIVSVPMQTERAWKLMRTILGTYMGVSALFTLVDLIKSTEMMDPHVTRGCVYFLHMALWGPHSPIVSLEVPYKLGIPVMVQASNHESELVVYEVSFAMKLLVGKRGPDLYPQAWDNVFLALTNIYKYAIGMTDSTKAQAILNVVNDTVDYMETLRDRDQLRVLREKFYTFLTPFTLLRTETSTLHVLNFLAKEAVGNCSEDGWLQQLSTVLVQYYVKDPRLAIKLQAAKWMVDCHKALGKRQGTELVEQIILPCVLEYRKESLPIRCAVVDILGYIVYEHNHPIISRCLELLLQTIFEPFKQAADGSEPEQYTSEEAEDVSKTVHWLILIFKRRMWDLPSADAIVAFRSLLTFLESHYTNPNLFLSLNKTRAKIFEMIFKIRANERYEIGMPGVEDASIHYGLPAIPGQEESQLPIYTPYIIINHKHGLTLDSAAVASSPHLARSSVHKIRQAATPTDTATIISTSSSTATTPVPHHSSTTPAATPTIGVAAVATPTAATAAAPATPTVAAAATATASHPPLAAGAAAVEGLTQGSEGEQLEDVLQKLQVGDDPWRDVQRHSTITYLSLTEAAATVIVAMKKEKDWEILKIILEGIPKMLQNKALIVSRDSNDIDYFAEALTAVITDRSLNLPASLYNTPDKFLRPDFEQYVFLALSCLSCYRQQLTNQWQNTMVQCLTGGMSRNCGAVCIAALTLCCLEMPNTMVKNLPMILQQLTKTSATVNNSQPVLEFLSTLLHLPHIYSFFSSDQYMAVFAIVIPYTNPIKFSQYVVILAFHVLAMWFLKCKLDNRRNFVNFITKNLRNVLGPDDAQPRRRSASLNDQDRTEVFAKLHKDMRMTLLDLMSRYTFASCTSMARRSEVGEALVGSGQQQTWLVGLKLFTITTSGCSQRPMTKQGLCENCLSACQHLAQLPEKLSLEDGKEGGQKPSDEKSEGASSSSVKWSGAEEQQRGTGAPPGSTPGGGDGISNSGQQAVKENHLCTCWCIGYSEVYVRQPTGNMVWMMRLQNHQQILEEGKQMSLDDLSALYGPGITPRPSHLQHKDLNRGGGCVGADLEQQQPSLEHQRLLLRRRRSSDRRGSDGSFTTMAGPLPPLITSGGGDTRRSSSGRVASGSPEPLKNAATADVAATGLTGSIIGTSARAVSVEEEDKIIEDRMAVQRSQSNPEIGDGDAPLGKQNTSLMSAKAAAAADAPAAGSSTEHQRQQQRTTEESGKIPSYKKKKEETEAEAPETSRGVFPGRVSTAAANATATGGASSSSPASPSKIFTRILHSKFNANLNKYFGNPSASSSGTTSPSVAPEHGDCKRLRHSSALSSSNTSFGQLNVSALTGGSQPLQQTHGSHGGEDCDVVPPMKRGRGHTISITNPASRPPPPIKGAPMSPLATVHASAPDIPSPPQPTQPHLQELFSKPWRRPQPGATTNKDVRKSKEKRGGVTPSNVLLQLLYSGNLEKSFERPLLIPMELEEFKRSIQVLDLTPPLENHSIGVLYVAKGQKTEQEILGNRIGSTRYNNFLRGLGTVVSLKKASKGFFLPGISDKGDDGDECYVWQDEIMQVGFHVATIMPNKPNDPKFVFKKRHIGNDFVTIVYNDSGASYDRDTIKTQFNTVIVEIRPAEHETNTVHLLLKPQIRDLLTTSPVVRLVSDTNLALYARQMALHSVIACRVQQQLNHPEPYAGNWLSRLRTTYRLRQRLLDRLQQMEDDETTDFTDMI